MMVGTGNVQPHLDDQEHNPSAIAKNVVMMALESGGGAYRAPTVFNYTNSDPIAVILVQPTTGTAYTATASGAGGGGGGISPGNTGMYTAIGVGAGAAVLLAPVRADRRSVIITSFSGNATAARVANDSSITAVNGGIEVHAGDRYIEDGIGVYNDAIYGISVSGTVTMLIWDRWNV